MQFAEAGEVGVVKECLCRAVHCLEVERFAHDATHELSAEGVLPRGHIVAIGAADGIEAGVGIGFYFAYLIYTDVLWKDAVELLCHGFGVEGCLPIEVCHHQAGVNASVGASGARHLHLFAQEGGQCLHQRLLHTRPVRLDLPSVVVCAIVS